MTPNSPLSSLIRTTIRRSPISWAHACHIHLRPYQIQIARAIKDSILNHRGLTFVIVLPRQSGKNELQAHIFAWLLYRYAHVGGRIVSVSPTFQPQTILNMTRVARSLDACPASRGIWKSTSGYIYQLGQACLQFYSGESRAKVVGATADLLLSVDEAQEVSFSKFDKDFDPMTASTNATRLFWGIPWTSNTLLDRERRIALRAQQKDGIQRLFYFTADDVRQLVPAYGLHVDRVIAEHGRDHPRVRSQYYCETIDAQSGMFTPARLALIISPLSRCVLPSGDRAAHRTLMVSRSAAEAGSEVGSPLPNCEFSIGERSGVGQGQGPEVGLQPPSSIVHSPPSDPHLTLEHVPPSSIVHGPLSSSSPSSFLLDVAGMDESRMNPASDLGLGNPGRDSTALTIVEIDLSTNAELGHPTYHVVDRHSWVGENHLAVFGKLKSLAATWHPQYIVIDATGVGEGLWALLDRAFPACVIPVKFTQSEKSEIGWRFLSIIETGRFRDHVHTDEVRLQYSQAISEVLPGPGKILRWGVPDGTRGPDGELIHDDFILADSLVAKLDELKWHISTPPLIVPARDPLLDMDRFFAPLGYDHFWRDYQDGHYFGDDHYDRSFGDPRYAHGSGDRENVRYFR
jgi:hypothetical protein